MKLPEAHPLTPTWVKLSDFTGNERAQAVAEATET